MTLILSGTNGLSDVDGSAATPAIRGTDANTGIFFPAADTIAFAEGGAEVARFDSSGNFGIGTATPNSRMSVAVSSTSTSVLGSYANIPLLLQNTSSTDNNWSVIGVQDASGDFSSYIGTQNTSQASNTAIMAFATNGGSGATERMRIDSSGNLLVNTTSAAGNASTFKSTAGAGQQAVSFWNNATASTRYFVTFGTEASYTERGFITWNGSTTALSNASDFRLKENIVNAPSALQKIAGIQIRSFDFKEDGRHVEYGVIAQELIEVIPAAVFEGRDNEDGSINKAWSVGLEPIIPVLVKALQEQQALITALTARITALEAK